MKDNGRLPAANCYGQAILGLDHIATYALTCMFQYLPDTFGGFVNTHVESVSYDGIPQFIVLTCAKILLILSEKYRPVNIRIDNDLLTIFALYHTDAQIAPVMLVNRTGVCAGYCKMLNVIAAIIHYRLEQRIAHLDKAPRCNFLIHDNVKG